MKLIMKNEISDAILNNYLHFATGAGDESATDAVIMSGEFVE